MQSQLINTLVGVFFATVLAASYARAEIYNCDGKWTNKPCLGKIEKTIPEIEHPVDLDAEALKKKRDLVSSLHIRVDEARLAYGIELDVSGIEETCKSESTSYEDCMNLVTNADDRLNTRINEAKLLREQEKANKLLEESAKSKDQDQGGNQAISITQDNSVVVVDKSVKIRVNEEQRGPRRDTPPHERKEAEKTLNKEKVKPKGGLGQGLVVR